MENSNNPYQVAQSGLVDENTPQEYGKISIYSHRGRIGRVRYFTHSFFVLIFFLILPILREELSGHSQIIDFIAAIFGLVIFFGFIFPVALFITTQRIHDFNRSGWWSLLIFVPYINVLFLISLFIIPGSHGSNKFGLQPPPNSKIGIVAFVLLLLWIGWSTFNYIVKEQLKEREARARRIENVLK